MAHHFSAQEERQVQLVVRTLTGRFHLQSHAVDDLAQEMRLHVLINAARIERAYDGRGTREAFLWRVFFNFGVSWIRRNGRERIRSRNIESVIAAVADPASTAEDALLAACEDDLHLRHHQTLRACLTRLAPTDRVFLAMVTEGVPITAVAAEFEITPAAAYSRLYRLERRLRRWLLDRIGSDRIGSDRIARRNR